VSSPGELLEPFLQELSLSLSSSTVGVYRYQLGRFFEFLETRGVKQVGCITPRDLAAYRHHLETVPGKRGKLVSDRYKQLALQVPQAFLKWACCTGLVLESAERFCPETLKGRAPHPTEKPVLSVAQVSKLLEAPDPNSPSGRRDRLILEVFYTLGLRRQESLVLDLSDISFQKQTLRVMGKGRKERLMPLSQRLCKLLDGYIRNTRPHLRPFPEEQALWISPNSGRRLTSESLMVVVVRSGRLVGLEGLHPHLLRHCCATHMLEGGASLKQIQTFLGHAGTKSTDHYTRVSPHDLQKEFRRCHPRALLPRLEAGP